MYDRTLAHRKLAVLSIMFAGIALAVYLLSTALAFPKLEENSTMQTAFLHALRNDMWMYTLLFALPVTAVVSGKKRFTKGAMTALLAVSIVYLCIQIVAAILYCVFLFNGVSSFYSVMFCSAAGRRLFVSMAQLMQNLNLRTALMVMGELSALTATLLCAVFFAKSAFKNTKQAKTK